MNEERNVANGIVVKVEGKIQMFLLDDDGNVLDMPSIPITDDDHIYDALKETQIQFMNVELSKIDPDDSIDFSNYDDFQKLQYSIHDLFSITIGKGEKKEDIDEVSVLTVMKEHALADLVHSIFVDKYK